MMSAKIFTRKATILLVIVFFCYYCKAEVQHKKPIKNSTNIEHLTVTPLNYEYLQTPNFNCLLLPEEAKNTEWKKYAALFDPPKSLSNTTPIAKTYKAGQRRKRLQRSNSTKTLNDPPPTTTSTELSDHNLPPVVSFSLERRIVETMFELLEKKNHIIVLQPRHCNAEQSEKSSSTAALMLQKNDRADFRNFAESLLQKLMQQLKNPNSDLIHPSEVPKPKVDPIVKRILEQLEREEEVLIKKIYNNLMDEEPTIPQSESYLRTKKSKNAGKHFDASSRNTIETKNAKNAKSSEIKEVPRSTRDCDKGYVFLVGSHNDGGKDLLMRAVRIVNKKER